MFKSKEDIDAVNDQHAIYNLLVRELPLPSDFVYGSATAAYQIEGGASQEDKGKSIWDTFTHLDPSRTNGQNADIACDHYNRMPEDVELIASLGLEVYRFSIAWSRVIPLGGRAYKIEPVVTLFHWDTPQGIYDRYGGFLNTAEFKADFEHFARLCFSKFGDRVKKWITFNEPYIISIFAHHSGVLAPGRSTATGGDSRTEPGRVGHTIILSHVAAIQVYANEFQVSQNGVISIVLNGHFYQPYDATSEIDRAAAQRRMEFYFGWFGDPVYLGKDYPASMREQLGSRLPRFTPDELELLRQSAPINAFYGMNHYTSKYARALPYPPAEDDWTGNVEESYTNSENEEIGPLSGASWLRVAPDGFRKLLNWVWNRYRLPIIVTENGCVCPGESQMTAEQAVDDRFRIRYFGLHLDSISRAIYNDGIPVKGYYAWSLMDNFEWSAGYIPRFGIVHTDFNTLVRTPKNSAFYLRDSVQHRRKLGLELAGPENPINM